MLGFGAVIVAWVLTDVPAADVPAADAMAADAMAADVMAACESALGDKPDAKAYRCFYIAARRGGDYARAASALEAAVARTPRDPWPRYVLADVYSDMVDDRAVALYRGAAAAFATVGDRENEGWVRLSLADAIAAGDLRGAGEQLELAELAATAANNDVLAATVMAERARHATRTDGDYVSALVLLDAAARRLGEHPAYQSRLVIAHVRANALEGLDRHAEAVVVRRRIAELAHDAGDVFVETSSWAAMAELAMRDPVVPDRTAAIDHARTALSLAEAHGNAYLTADVRCLLGELGDGDRAAHFGACRDGAADDPALAAAATLGLAWHDVDTHPQRAKERLAHAMVLLREGGGEGHEAAVVRAAIAWRLDDRAHAIATSRAVLEESEAAIARQRHAVGRAQFLAQRSDLFHYVAHAAIDGLGPHPDDAAIDVSLDALERWRGRVLVEHLDASGVLMATRSGGVGAAHSDAVDRVDAAYARMMAIAPADDGSDIDALEIARAALRDAENAATAAWDAVLAEHPARDSLRIATPSVAEIRAALAPGEALISYQLGTSLEVPAPDHPGVPAWAWVFTRDQATMVLLPAARDVGALVGIYVGAIESRSGADAAVAVGLHRLLLAPALATLTPEIDTLIIVPEAELFGLPWSTLRPSADSPVEGSHFAFAVAPSIATFLHLRRRPPPRTASALVLADPLVRGGTLPPLSFAHEEASRVAEHLGVVDTVVAVGALATEDALHVAGPLAIVHFATHAVTDRVHVDRQALALAPSLDGDGWLRPHEIARLELGGALVVLAGCRSADGQLVGGEGPVGLSRAFLLGGARAVVSTLWPVRDDEAARFSAHFYSSIDTGRSVTQAVADAQLALREAGLAPAAWAAFVVVGDGSWSPRPRRSPAPWLGALAWVLAATATGGAALRFARRTPRSVA